MLLRLYNLVLSLVFDLGHKQISSCVYACRKEHYIETWSDLVLSPSYSLGIFWFDLLDPIECGKIFDNVAYTLTRRDNTNYFAPHAHQPIIYYGTTQLIPIPKSRRKNTNHRRGLRGLRVRRGWLIDSPGRTKFCWISDHNKTSLGKANRSHRSFRLDLITNNNNSIG